MGRHSFNLSPPIPGDRLLLREWRLEPNDVASVLAGSGDPAIARQCAERGGRAPTSPQAAERWICAGYDLAFEGRGARLAIAVPDTQRVLGCLQFDTLNADPAQLEVRVCVLAAERGRRVATRALEAAIGWLAVKRPRAQLWAAVPAGQPAAVTTLHRCGFSGMTGAQAPATLGSGGQRLFQRPLRIST